MSEWELRPGVINETVLAAKRFLEKRPEEVTKMGFRSNQYEPIGEIIIEKFLGWKGARVRFALASLRDVESGIVDREAVEMMPHLLCNARHFNTRNRFTFSPDGVFFPGVN